MLRLDERRSRTQRRRKDMRDEAHFLRSWFEKPLQIGAVAPSSRKLAELMASYLDPARPGSVIELGPGTGPVTQALVNRGFAEDRLVLVEFNPEFCRLLRQRFPGARIVQGDAYGIRQTLAEMATAEAAGVISSLPLLTKPVEKRHALLDAAFQMMAPGGCFVQFTYGTQPPIPPRIGQDHAIPSRRIWLNIPPAQVWVYRRV